MYSLSFAVITKHGRIFLINRVRDENSRISSLISLLRSPPYAAAALSAGSSRKIDVAGTDGGAVIVYVHRQKDAALVAEALRRDGFKAVAYHGIYLCIFLSN